MSSSFVENEDDDIEKLLAKAKEESLRYYKEIELPRLQKDNEVETPQRKDEEQKLEDNSLSTQVGGKAGSVLYEGVEAQGFHLSAGSTYIYPTNYPVRHYQASIVKTALFKNTLVSLPTGLGKTFIAAVVMYNFYRWYPHGKVVFMAPTRPLVAQQTKACHHIMNIPQEDTTEMTGAQSAEQRCVLWKEKRVFYLTPQVMVNDLKVKACPASLIKCVVIDEAHRATKDYAYCQVLKMLSDTDAVFRVLGLSATPGNDISAVQQVVQNLHISALEMRSEESLDVAPYIHSRSIETVVVDLSDNIQRVKEDLLQVYEKYAKKLKDFKALSCNISSISRFQVLKASEKFRANPPRGLPPAMIGTLYSDFSVCMSLAHALELLQIYGLRAFYSYLSDENGDKNKSVATRLRNDDHLKEMLNRLQSCLFSKPNENSRYTWGHPKLQKLVTALSSHFQNAEKNKESTKAIIFCQYRVVVAEIVELLKKFKPLINATEFIGQSGGKDKGMPQAKQLQIMKDFRNGLINCLVATCVAEEGLDIGEVDLIILMEAHKSPVRLVQRIGRTGRKRKGQCIVLLTRGREEQKFRDAMATRKSYVQNIVNAPAVKASLCQESPRMIPPQCDPVQQLVHIHASNFESPARPALKKQTDIRKCLAAQASNQPNEDDLLKAKEEFRDLELNFNYLLAHRELWHRQHAKQISIEELLSEDINALSEWNEWNREEHPTYYISHSSQSKLLCQVLKAASTNVLIPSYFSNTDSVSNYNEEDDKSSLPEANKKHKNNVKKSNGMDIRDCLTVAIGKTMNPKNQIIEIPSDVSENDSPSAISEPEPKKLKVSCREEPLLFNPNKLIFSAFEENNNINVALNKYLLPSKNFKQSLSFDLPDLETLLNNVSFELLFSMNFNSISIAEIQLPLSSSKSPVSVLGSPAHSPFFQIDDLFDEESDPVNNIEIVNSNSTICQFSQKNIISEPSSTKFDNISEHLNNYKSELEKSYNLDSYVKELDKPVRHEDLEKAIHSEPSVDETNLIVKKNSSPDITSSFENEELTLHCADMKTEVYKSNELATLSKHSPEYFHSLKNTNAHKLPQHRIDMSPTSFMEIKSSQDRNISNSFPIVSLSNERIVKLDHCTPNRNASSQSPVKEGLSSKFIINSTEEVNTETGVSVVSGIACSTPIASVKKFKKNIILADNSAQIVEEKERLDKSPHSEGSDMWNLSDLFEDEEEDSALHNTTMLGITQMVSLIEKEKIQNRNPIKVTLEKSVECVQNETNKTNVFSAILDSDADIFSEINDNFQTDCINEKYYKKDEVDNELIVGPAKDNLKLVVDNCNKINLPVIENDVDSAIKKMSQKEESKELKFGNTESTSEPFGATEIMNKKFKLLAKDGSNIQKSNECSTRVIHASEGTEQSQLAIQSQPVNFKKFSAKKVLFSQKCDLQADTMKDMPQGELGCKIKNDIQSEKLCINENTETFFNSNYAKNQDSKTNFVDGLSHVFSDDSDDSVFLHYSQKDSNKRKEDTTKTEEISQLLTKKVSSDEKKITKKKKKLKDHNGLIEVEADVSGSASSDDSEGSSLDKLDNSFINDDSEMIANCTQTMYLKSIKSPVGHGKFKIPNNINYNQNVFSQQIPEDSEYINDSFCVDSDEETDIENERSLSFLEIAEEELEKKSKQKRGVQKQKMKENKRRRIQNITSDSSSPEKSPQRIESSSQPSPRAAMNRKKRRIQSDSETEISPHRNKSFKRQRQFYKTIGFDESPKLSIRECNSLRTDNIQRNNDLSIKEMNIFVEHKFGGQSHSEEHNYNCRKQSKNKLDKSLQKLSKKLANNLNKITQKYFGLDSSEE